MAHQLVRQTPSGITIASGGTITAAVGSTVTISGTLNVPAGSIVATGAIASTTTLKAGSSLEVTTTSLLKGDVTMNGSLTIGAGAGTIVDGGGNDMIITENTIHITGSTAVILTGPTTITGVTGITGATTVTGAFGVTGQTTLTGGATDPALVLSGAGNLDVTENRTAVGDHVADTASFAFKADQLSMRIKIGGTVYQIPLWADA